MPETLLGGNVDAGIQTGTPQVDNFSKELSDFLLDEKLTNKEQISNLLISNLDLKTGFENFLKTANLRQKIKCKKELQNCSTEEEIKSIIVENLPEGYKVGSSEVGNTETIENTVESEDFFNVKEQADQDKEQIEQRTEMIDKNSKIITALKSRQDLLNSHPDQEKAKKIDEKTRNEAEKVKNNLSEETKNQLKEKGYDENFINDYILLRVTANEVKNDSSFDKNVVAQFESKVNELGTLDVILKNIDNACNTPDTSLDSFSSENISQTRTELFHGTVGNKDLIGIRDNNIEVRKYPEGFFDMGEDEIIVQYGKFLPNEYKRLLEDYARQYEQNNIDEYKESKDYKTLLSAVNSIKVKVDNDIKNMMEELCIISQIKGMYMCMGEGTDFDLNKSREIRFDDEGAMVLDGHIDGMDFAIRQDINNPKAKLQTSQKLSKNGEGFVVSGKDRFVDSNFILPSQDEIFESIKETVKFDDSLEDSNNPEDYLKNLQESIMGTMEEKYKDTELVHHYMKQQVKGEKLVNKALGFINKINPSITNNETLMKNINKDNNKDLYVFMKVLKFNIDNSTDVEKDHFNRCIDEIGRIIDNYRTNKKSSGLYSDEISKCLENDIWIDGTQEDGLKLIFDLFNHFNENSVDDGRLSFEGDDGIPSNMIINDLYIQLHDKPKEKKQQQERDNATNIEAQNAEGNLDLALLSI